MLLLQICYVGRPHIERNCVEMREFCSVVVWIPGGGLDLVRSGDGYRKEVTAGMAISPLMILYSTTSLLCARCSRRDCHWRLCSISGRHCSAMSQWICFRETFFSFSFSLSFSLFSRFLNLKGGDRPHRPPGYATNFYAVVTDLLLIFMLSNITLPKKKKKITL